MFSIIVLQPTDFVSVLIRRTEPAFQDYSAVSASFTKCERYKNESSLDYTQNIS